MIKDGSDDGLVGIGAGIALEADVGFAMSDSCGDREKVVSRQRGDLSLDGGGFGLRAAMTLACVLVFQTIAMGIYLAVREPGQFLRVIAAWRIAMWVGVVGMLASAGWFTAMTLKNAFFD